jgi:chromosomal replication initiation ATPase DnaA
MSDSIVFMEQAPVGLQGWRDRARAALLIHLVAMATGVPPQDVLEASRAKSAGTRARWVAMYLMHTSCSVPLMRVAAAFGRDRTTISHVVHRIEDWRSDPAFDAALSELEQCAVAAPLEFLPDLLGVEGRFASKARELAA